MKDKHLSDIKNALKNKRLRVIDEYSGVNCDISTFTKLFVNLDADTLENKFFSFVYTKHANNGLLTVFIRFLNQKEPNTNNIIYLYDAESNTKRKLSEYLFFELERYKNTCEVIK